MLHSNSRYPGWVQGWVVFKGGWRPRCVGVFETRDEARAAAEKAGPGFEVRWGSYDERAKDFVTGSPFETI
ncbi:MAG TPA: hypothetical protein VFW46_23240 [Stellaceae bacterium]|nr:hypothetical protein [Stellaceae bacterium]